MQEAVNSRGQHSTVLPAFLWFFCFVCSSSVMFQEPCDSWYINAPFIAEHPAVPGALHLDQLLPLCSHSWICKQPKLTVAEIYGQKDRFSEGSLTGASFPFSKTTSVVSPLGSMSSPIKQIYDTWPGSLVVECASNWSRRHWLPHRSLAILPSVFSNSILPFGSCGTPIAVPGDWGRPRTFWLGSNSTGSNSTKNRQMGLCEI